jgi:hypothetical protein
MIWLTWRQFRIQTLVAAALLAASAVALAITGAHLAHLYATSGIGNCHAHGDCQPATSNFLFQVNATLANHLPLLFGTALVVVPAVIGVFWGAPVIARELEAGTYRLAWNQSITRTRWLAVKLALVGLAGMAAAGLFSLMVTWSASPIDAVNMNRLLPSVFSQRGIAPVGYAAFAFALGVTAGLLIRRTVPAMAVTLAVFTAVQFLMRWVRPHLIAPVRATTALTAANINFVNVTIGNGGPSRMTAFAMGNPPGAWVVSSQDLDRAGHVFTGPAPLACQGGNQQACTAAIARLHLRQLVTYQPASRFWAFQWQETAIFLAVAMALAGFCFWQVRRRRS